MAVWQFDIFLVPTTIIDDEELTRAVALILPPSSSWSDSLLIWGQTDGDTIQLLKEEGAPTLEVRFDLRKASNQFLNDVVSLAKRFKYKITDECGNDVELTARAIVARMAGSDALRFVTNPIGFLDSL